MKLNFTKMNGAGNDFVVIDARPKSLILNFEQVRAIASRENSTTKGCDQVIVMEPSKKADVFMRIYNADGGEVDACGNATRCIGAKIIEDKKDAAYVASIETNAGLLGCKRNAKGMEANMGHPRFTPGEIPVGSEFDEAKLKAIAIDLGIDHVVNAACLGMGNPHVVFFVKTLPPLMVLESAGEWIKKIPLFEYQGVNLTIAKIEESVISAYVYERGAGITKSCGTAACATAVAAVKIGARKHDTDILVRQMQREPQDLYVRWEKKSDDVFLIGQVEEEFQGKLAL